MQKRIYTILLLLLLLTISVFLLPVRHSRAATTIYTTNFNTGYTGWSAAGTIDSVASPAIAPNSVRMRAVSTLTRTISTSGYSAITFSWNLAGSSLETGDFCYAEVNTGSGWSAVGSITDGQDNSVFIAGNASLGTDANNNAAFQVRFRSTGATTGDYCYVEDMAVSGNTGAPTNTPVPPTNTPPGPTATPGGGGGVNPVPGDPLTGNGNVTRTLLTYNDLNTGSSTAPVDDSAFALPANAAPPLHTFEGRLQLTNPATSGGFTEIKDANRFYGSGDEPIKHLPSFSFEFVQNGSHLIPVVQGLYITGSPYWNYHISPGRVWSENGDNGYSRASFPFALIQYNHNCMHNGVMTFLFNNSGISKVRYQITQETCYLQKYNMWGQLNATYTPYSVSGATTLKNAHAAEVANRIPTKPISALATDFPGSGVNVAQYGSGITPEHMTFYGLYINGTNYVSGCTTRYGTYAFCEVMRAPSYSTAKSAMAGVALMRLGQKYGTGVYNQLIKDYVPEYSSGVGVWTNVNFNHTIDMATGNYRLAGYMSDEDGSYMNTFLTAVTYTDKINAAFNWPNKAAPGSTWVYHTSDTFLVGRAMNNYNIAQGGTDIWTMLVNEVYVPAGMSRGFMTTLRTDNSPTGVPYAGYGEFWTRDDLAKLVRLLNNTHGVAGGTQILQPAMLDDAMQDDPTDRGLPTSTQPFLYNNGFWAKQFTPAEFPQYSCTFYVPFMSGYGGITIAMMPNGATYYYISDNAEFSWYNAVNETDKLIDECP